MLVRLPILLSFVLLIVSLAVAQEKSKNNQNQNADKKKILLPSDILQARTVLVLVDPDAGTSMTDPRANRTAQEDVEKALLHWGRFTPVMEAQTADLVITVRKGNGKMVNPTVGGIPPNDRPVILEGDNSVIRIGGQKGHPADTTEPRVGESTGPTPRTEVGQVEDVFEVYRGGVGSSLDSAPLWRYIAKGALRPPSVPAVEAFRKAVEEAEQQQKAKP
ncbi:MAG TPA: hypothetical protein VK699_19555 [Terriglobales bacterium]|jgi:hypothetical protein|nr:hypothetical protein [Terriglobales bacterium]